MKTSVSPLIVHELHIVSHNCIIVRRVVSSSHDGVYPSSYINLSWCTGLATRIGMLTDSSEGPDSDKFDTREGGRV